MSLAELKRQKLNEEAKACGSEYQRWGMLWAELCPSQNPYAEVLTPTTSSVTVFVFTEVTEVK